MNFIGFEAKICVTVLDTLSSRDECSFFRLVLFLKKFETSQHLSVAIFQVTAEAQNTESSLL